MSTIKLTIDSTAEPLTHIINLSISHGIVPDDIKIARVIPLFKSGDLSYYLQTTDLSRFFLVFLNFLKHVILYAPGKYICIH